MTDASNRTTAAQGGEPSVGDNNSADTLAPTSTTVDGESRTRLLVLVDAHGDELQRFVLGVVRDPELARDVMQATLSKALELGHTARPDTFKGWLFRVAFHEAMASRRRERAGDRARRRLATLTKVGSDPPADDRVVRNETVEAVRDAVGRLPDAQRRVVVARVYDDKTFAEIARESGLPLGTVLTRMRLALARLRDALRATDDHEPEPRR
jgi:RNA polymerase sigma-70 factor (ECF subfamily)